MNYDSLCEAATVVCQGGIVAYPTESCYGLGCDPRRNDVIRRLLRIKQRPWQLGFIVIAADIAQLAPYLGATPEGAWQRARATWPGPVTWILPADTRVSPWLRGEHQTLAVRVTAHLGAAALCRHARRAIISTSANRHGHPPARSARAVVTHLGKRVDYVLPGRLGGLAAPTEIRDAMTGTIVRAG